MSDSDWDIFQNVAPIYCIAYEFPRKYREFAPRKLILHPPNTQGDADAEFLLNENETVFMQLKSSMNPTKITLSTPTLRQAVSQLFKKFIDFYPFRDTSRRKYIALMEGRGSKEVEEFHFCVDSHPDHNLVRKLEDRVSEEFPSNLQREENDVKQKIIEFFFKEFFIICVPRLRDLIQLVKERLKNDYDTFMRKLHNPPHTISLTQDFLLIMGNTPFSVGSSILELNLVKQVTEKLAQGELPEEIFSHLLQKPPTTWPIKCTDLEDIPTDVSILEGQDFNHIKDFVRNLNQLIFETFPIIWKRFFNENEKLGIIIWRDPASLPYMITYSIFSILFSQNTPLVKELGIEEYPNLNRNKLVRGRAIRGQDFLAKPYYSALGIIEQYLETLFTGYFLDNTGDDYLAQEFIFSMIDHHQFPPELPVRDEYMIFEIKEAFLNSIKEIKNNPETDLIIDIGKGYPYRFWAYAELLLYYLPKGNKTLVRNAPRVDIKKLYETDPNYPNWFYSKDGIERDIRRYYEILPKAYKCVLNNNFAAFTEKVIHFHNATRLVVFVDYGPNIAVPGLIKIDIEEWFLQCEDENNFETEVIFNVKHPELSKEDRKESWMHNGKNYKIITYDSGKGAECYEDLGMLKRIYRMLWESISEFFGFKKFLRFTPN
ncbi:MAG: hypothetical protein RBG13Loki_0085 [Promethearchaeota archaeon CR_4]|nr:MAG: hypothetical protein RBG13Loki_0085 [Candidatus Lokiarchaeota archaeon CR_4]